MSKASGGRRNEPRSDDYSYPKWREPELTSSRLAEIARAAKAHADRNRSDPFAYGRIFLHMRRGIEAPSEILAACGNPPSA